MRNKVVIIEGAQGVGKGTISSILREQMPYTNLLRLSGTNDKTKMGKNKVLHLRKSELDMIMYSKDCSINYIMDRSHISESVYCQLGYKDYEFEEETKYLNTLLNTIGLHYDVHFILLKATKEEFERRLKRDKPEFLNVNFNSRNSMRQQEEYHVELYRLRRYPSINCHEVFTDGRDPYDIAYDILSVVRE